MVKLFIANSFILIPLFSLGVFVDSIASGETKVGDRELLTRESIGRAEKRQVILENRNIDFKKLSQIEIFFGNSLVKCFFGYQNEHRLVLCY